MNERQPTPPRLKAAKFRNLGRELARRQDCRYGLRGVRVQHADFLGVVFVVESAEWDANGELALDLIPEGTRVKELLDGVERVPEDDDFDSIDSEELFAMEFVWPEGSVRQASADKCELIDDWPVVCRCWDEEATADDNPF
jgi:hypothetical protein